MLGIISSDSLKPDSNLLYVEGLSGEQISRRQNTHELLNSTQLSGALVREIITISSVATPEPQIVSIASNSNEPTIQYGYGRRAPNILPCLNHLNLPLNPCNVMTPKPLAAINERGTYAPAADDSPTSTTTFTKSEILTSSMIVSTVDAWERSSDVGAFYS